MTGCSFNRKKKEPNVGRGLNEKKAFSDIAAADYFGVNDDKPFN